MSFDALGIFLGLWSAIIFILSIVLIVVKFRREAGELNSFGNILNIKKHGNARPTVFKERRLFERLELQLKVVLEPIGDGESFEAQTKDISSRGIGVYTKKLLPVMANTEVVIKISDSDSFTARGKVVWVKKIDDAESFKNMGIKFDNLLTNELIKIYKYLSDGKLSTLPQEKIENRF